MKTTMDQDQIEWIDLNQICRRDSTFSVLAPHTAAMVLVLVLVLLDSGMLLGLGKYNM